MFQSGSWLHIIIGFLVGISSITFIYSVRSLVKQHAAISKIAFCQVIYTSTIVSVMYMYGTGLSGGILTEWQSLGKPAFGDRALKLIDIGYVEAQSINRYQFLYGSDQQGTWQLVEEMIKEVEYLSAGPSKDRGTLFFLPLPRENIVDTKAACLNTGFSRVKEVYAIDEDRSVYLWQHWSSNIHSESTARFFIPLIAGGASCLFGIVTIMLVASFSSVLLQSTSS
jgi:hypothetical protein